jgi:hypothetical protein
MRARRQQLQLRLPPREAPDENSGQQLELRFPSREAPDENWETTTSFKNSTQGSSR